MHSSKKKWGCRKLCPLFAYVVSGYRWQLQKCTKALFPVPFLLLHPLYTHIISFVVVVLMVPHNDGVQEEKDLPEIHLQTLTQKADVAASQTHLTLREGIVKHRNAVYAQVCRILDEILGIHLRGGLLQGSQHGIP
jgi:hypothetical protein